jgi:hypothetical protein
MRYTLLLFLKIYLLIVLLMSVRKSSIKLFTRPRDPCLGSCQGDVGIPEYVPLYRGSILPRMHIIEDRNDANDILHRSQPMVAEYFCCLLLDIISARH